ncbi:MAG: MFS transporter [Thermoplasmatales archaeon]|jgi:PHS family inorganic phosphate transporter-like MFS transporter|nr:MFS transporter [Thermoplasmatales archaeon]
MSSRAFRDIDDVPLNFNHLKVWFTSGMGFFTDAYDLFIIGIVLIILEGSYSTSFHVTGGNALVGAGLLGSSAIIAAIFGQLIWGTIADKFGRKKIYGLEAGLLAAGAILSAFAWNYWSLFIFRFILGFGIGGDYPVSATIMSEYSNTKDRGKLIALVFANQGIGSVAAVAVGLGAVAVLPAEIAWRFMLAFGAIPALAVIYMRRKLPETPRYAAIVKKDSQGAMKAAGFIKSNAKIDTGVNTNVSSVFTFFKNYWKTLIVTAGSWFLLDIAFYGTGIFSGPITGSIIPATDLSSKIVLAGIPFMVGFFGYFSAVALMDKAGRRTLQVIGFAAMGILYFLVSSFIIAKGTKITGFVLPVVVMFALYSLTFFFIDMGPNTTTFVVPAEVYPVKFRTTGHGISAAAGKTGAAITTFFFVYLLASIGLKEVLMMLAIVSFVGAVISIFLKETKNVPLEEAAGENISVEKTDNVLA